MNGKVETYLEKKAFVEDYIKPMAIAMGIGVTDVEYRFEMDPDHGWASESVHVYYGDGPDAGHKYAIVNMDSKFAILKDLIKQEALG